MINFKRGLLVTLLLAFVTLGGYASPNAIKEKAPPGTVELVLQNDAVNQFDFEIASVSVTPYVMTSQVIIDISLEGEAFTITKIAIAEKEILISNANYIGFERYWTNLNSNIRETDFKQSNTLYLHRLSRAC